MSNQRTLMGNRRTFLSGASALAAAAALPGGVHAQGSEVIKVGLIGCGGRGTGAANNALRADPHVRLTAMGDVFGDKIQASLNQLKGEAEVAGRIEVKPETSFTGFDAYKKVIESGVDVVLLTTPPHFRAEQIRYAIEKGKHVFAEKPVAVDPSGVRKVLAACEEAKKKNLAVVSGLCWRYHRGKRATMAQIHEGKVGEIVAMHTNYNVGGLWNRPRQPGWSDMEAQLRNWLYYCWLSGDHLVEQHIHSLDKCMWTMKDEPPVAAYGLGGRQVRTGKDYGHIFDHHAVVYEWKNGAKCFSFCRQIDGCYNDVNDYILGTEGRCDVMKHQITGKNAWRHSPEKNRADDMYQNEHDELFASIRAGKPINDGNWMCQSTLMAIMGRTASYTGKRIEWANLQKSLEDLTPDAVKKSGAYAFGPLTEPAVAVPGKTPVL